MTILRFPATSVRVNKPVFVIAIDGPTASGKGTLARQLASTLGFAWLETGALYRAVAYQTLSHFITADDEAAIQVLAQNMAEHFNADDLRNLALRADEVAQRASQISAFPGVRAALLDLQRNFAAQPPVGQGAVLDGRDIGTVVCPDAPIKLYITADINARAQRRTQELQNLGHAVTQEQVLAELLERDTRDQTRATAPLRPAADAVVIDTTNLSAEEVLSQALGVVGHVYPHLLPAAVAAG